MAKNQTSMLQAAASKKVLQILVAFLFIAMGFLGFSSQNGLGNQISRELSKMFGGDNELLLSLISALELICGVFLVVQLFVKGIPDRFVKLALIAILVFWVVLIALLDILSTDFARLNGSQWFSWLEQIVSHLIVLATIIQIQE